MKNLRFYLKLNEDATKYGEFVCSCYKWLPPEKQKEIAKHLENIGNIEKK